MTGFGPLLCYSLISLGFAQTLTPAPQNPSPMVDSTRPHPRLQKQEVAGRRFALSVGALYLSPKFSARQTVPLIVHFHGAGWLVEYNVARAAPQAALVTVNLGAGSGVYSQGFSEASRFRELLEEALKEVSKATGRDVRWGSITLTSFSAGYGAIRSILRDQRNYDRVDAILLADSLHTSYYPEGTPPKLEEAPLEVFAWFAVDAAERRKHMWVTHSEVYPGTFASTTETADYLLERLQVKRTAILRRGPIGMQQLSQAAIGNFHVWGFAGNTAPDHMDHLYAMGDWLKQLSRVFQAMH